MSYVSWNRQLALAIALFTLGTLAYWLEFKHKPTREAADEQSKKLFSLKETPIQSITFGVGTKTVTLNCTDFAAKLCKPGDNSKWEISEPARLKADDANVNSLVSSLNNLNSNDIIDLKDESPEKKSSLLKEYGLDPTSLKTAKSIKIATAAGETILYLGQTHPMGESLFAAQEKVPAGQNASRKIDESPIYLIGTYFSANFDHDLAYWRNKKLFSLGPHEITSLKLEGKNGELSAERKEGQWALHSKGETFTGDIENIDNLLTATTFLSAKSFNTKDALKSFSKVLTLTLQKDKGDAQKAPTPIQLTLFQKKPFTPTGKLLATMSNLDPIFELDPSTKDRLDKSVKELRLNKLLTSMEKFSAKHIEFSGKPIGEHPLILNNENGKWLIPSDKSEAASDKVQNTLDKLTGNRIKDFLTGKAIPAGEQDGLQLVLGDDKFPTKRQILFWKKDGKLYARDPKSNRKEAFLIDSSVESGLPWTKDFYKPVQVSKPETKTDAAKK